jgi:hypothetical protein
MREPLCCECLDESDVKRVALWRVTEHGGRSYPLYLCRMHMEEYEHATGFEIERLSLTAGEP